MAIGDAIWFEIWVSDLEKAKDFYGSLFGWDFEPFTEYDPDSYWLIRKESNIGISGALVKRSGSEQDASRRSTILYLQVDDLDSVTSNVLKHGGSVAEHAKAIGTVDGTFSVVVDPDGNSIGLWTD